MKKLFITNKKKIFILIGTMIIAVFATINVNLNSNRVFLSDLCLENVEALAQGEGDPLICYSIFGCQYNLWYDCYIFWNYGDDNVGYRICPYMYGV